MKQVRGITKRHDVEGQDVEHALRIAQSALGQIDGAMHASVSVPSTNGLVVRASTDLSIESPGELCTGPSVAVLDSGRIVRVPTVERSDEFPEYVAKCRRLGINSVAAFPVKDAALRTVAVLTISSADHHGFGTADLRAGRRVAEQLASVGLFHPVAG